MKSEEQQSIKIFITSAKSKEQLATVLYQLPTTEQLQNQFGVGESQNFTGLASIYNPNSRTKLQYWCGQGGLLS